MNPLRLVPAIAASLCFAVTAGTSLADTTSGKPLRALLIAGGCCHDYANQQQALCEGIQSRANVQVDVYWTDNSTTAPVLPIYENPNWAKRYDVIIHDECAANIKDQAIVDRIVQTHQTIPAVHLHCAMHSFRTGGDAWFKHLGLQSSSHGPQEPIEIQFVDTKHPITETLGNWTTVREELYNNVKLLGAHPLAIGKQIVGNGNNARVDQAVVAWTNETQGARSFSTTIGHNTETVQDPRYLDLVTRGLLWACGNLSPEYLQPFAGKNKVTFLDKEKFKAPISINLGEMPDDATLVKAKASSTQSSHDAYMAVDGNKETRWCASGASYPQWLQLELEEPHVLSEIEIAWEFSDRPYQYKVEGSADGKTWSLLLDHANASDVISTPQELTLHSPSKFVRITGISSNAGWCSIREVKFSGQGVGSLWPADANKKNFVALSPDPYAKQGNVYPTIEKLSEEQEATLLSDVKVADGFEATLFAAPPAVNYPVFVAADVDGTLYVSSDGNGSLGRSPRRGRVIRLRDLDNDGRADETKVFCEVDAPRGLVWDHDRLYLMHPPHLSAFIDHDGDGEADEQKILVKNLAFDYGKRPADHTTNGVSLGVDGWLYIAGGDFGFIDAEGTDGRRLTHRGGGVIRVRPDGTGLEVYSTGTRNILEVAISPEMEMFARDNTNDGGGWDVRLHHFTGNDDHGYPRLYKNFPDECVQPLADYGGGSGCGAVYIDEPGFGKWNHAPFTADWGTGALYRHTVAAKGASYEETQSPEPFIRMTRPTDADVDGNSRVYCASWRGATFNWNGPDVGYIVCVKPKDFTATKLPNFDTASDEALIAIMKSPSARRRMEAERELMRRGNAAHHELLQRGLATRNDQRKLAESLQADATDPASIQRCIASLSSDDPVIVHVAIRSLAKHHDVDACFAALDDHSVPARRVLRSLAMIHQPAVVDGLIQRLTVETAADRKQAILEALCRLHFREGKWNGDSWGTRPDTRGPYYQPASWSETDKIAAVLKQTLRDASGNAAAKLISAMTRNRIESNDSLLRLVQLAKQDPSLIGQLTTQLIAKNEVPHDAVPVLVTAADRSDLSAATLADVVKLLSTVDDREASASMIAALVTLQQQVEATKVGAKELVRARNALINAPHLDTQTSSMVTIQSSTNSNTAFWAEAALIAVASRSNASPENRELAKQTIDDAWQNANRRVRLMQAAATIENHLLDAEILAARSDANVTIADTAKAIVKQMKIAEVAEDHSATISSLSTGEAATQAVAMKGNLAVGQQIFTKANCVACHTISEDEVQKGPFLGNIAKTYKRPDLAIAILEPSKTIAQGFVTNSILTLDGVVLTGFVTNEQSDRVTIRDQQGKETTIAKDDIEVRQTSPISVMPEGVMNDYTTHELASLLDYLESLAAANAKE
ncbi:heme-binding protein [Rhodopirellula maiorica SM1]|uniref:Heme-binding protein n=1 Tax=Rhodopirellula maiorica SM1 TaxID=1265738 RepID=M5RFY9_9BACT|nr:discoidin domain-containing protein [Rhodopirellula maiorica]EMI18046.1 heme-binding protein [Rhodopirellula maiorica SM1]